VNWENPTGHGPCHVPKLCYRGAKVPDALPRDERDTRGGGEKIGQSTHEEPKGQFEERACRFTIQCGPAWEKKRNRTREVTREHEFF